MFKKLCFLVIIASTLTISGQNATLLKNFNPKAKDLKHNLNNTGDSLIISCAHKIVKVEIFNDDFEKVIDIENFETQIPLTDLPTGKFVVEARLEDRIIAMKLIKFSNPSPKHAKSDVAGGIGMMLDENFNVIKSPPKNSIEFILTGSKTKRHTTKNQKFFWTVTKINTESGSSRTMKLVDQESVKRMILKNKLENNSTLGKSNELIVWEVYNTSKFMEHQLSDPNFIHSSTSDFFNTRPYYSTESNLQSL